MFHQPMSSPQRMRMFGFLASGISLSRYRRQIQIRGSPAPRDCRLSAKRSSAEGRDVELHAGDRRHPDGEQQDRCNQGERHRKDGLAVNEAVLSHRLPQPTKTEHELNMVDNTEDQHHNAQEDQRETEIPRRMGPSDDILLPEPLEELENRKPKADQRQGGAD